MLNKVFTFEKWLIREEEVKFCGVHLWVSQLPIREPHLQVRLVIIVVKKSE